MKWREWRGRSCWLEAMASELDMAYCYAEWGNRESTVAGKLVAFDFVHEQWIRKSLPRNHFRIKAVREGIQRAYVERGSQQRMRRPLSWEMLKEMEEAAKEWRVGGRVAWIGLDLTYLLLLRASELFAEDNGSLHAVYVLRVGDVAFYTGERQFW